MEDEWEPGGSMSLWDVIPRLLKAKTQRRLAELEGVPVGGHLPYYDLNDLDEERFLDEIGVNRHLSGGMTEKWLRGSLGPRFASLRANEHEQGLEHVASVERDLRTAALQINELGLPEPESSRRWRNELYEMGAVIRHHRDHSPGPWMQGYVYPESTGVPTGY
jgi:hypothetical protein